MLPVLHPADALQAVANGLAAGVPAGALGQAEETLDLVAAIELAGAVQAQVAEAGRRDDGALAQFARQLACLVGVFGAMQDHRRVGHNRPEEVQPLAADRASRH